MTKTIVEFTLTFDQNAISPDAKLFSKVRATKRLDEMPVYPKSLKVSGKYSCCFTFISIPSFTNDLSPKFSFPMSHVLDLLSFQSLIQKFTNSCSAKVKSNIESYSEIFVDSFTM